MFEAQNGRSSDVPQGRETDTGPACRTAVSTMLEQTQ
jgi:hypothetical protein